MPVITANTESYYITVQEAVAEFIMDRRIRRLSEQTIAFYERRLTEFLAPWWGSLLSEVTWPAVRERIAVYGKRLAPATVNGYIRVTKALLRWALKEGYAIAFEPSSLGKVKEPKRVTPHLADPSQIGALLAEPDTSTFVGLRDYTMLLVMLDTGIRVGELVGLDTGDVSGGCLLVRGKGDKQRMVALSLPAQRALMKYLRVRARHVVEDDCLFPSQPGQRITKRSVQLIVRRHGDSAGLGRVRLSPHKLRATMATHFLRNGGSIVSLQQILGHTTLAMSRHYAQMVDQDAFEASRAYSPVAMLGSV